MVKRRWIARSRWWFMGPLDEDPDPFDPVVGLLPVPAFRDEDCVPRYLSDGCWKKKDRTE